MLAAIIEDDDDDLFKMEFVIIASNNQVFINTLLCT